MLRTNDAFLRDCEVVVAATKWIGNEVPDVANPLLKEVLHENRFSFAGKPCIAWPRSLSTRGLRQIGNITLPRDMSALKCNTLSTWDGFAEAILGEWRWIHDQNAYKADVEADRIKREADLRMAEAHRQGKLTLKALAKANVFSNWTLPHAKRWRTNAEEIHKDLVSELLKLRPPCDKGTVEPHVRAYLLAFKNLDMAGSLFMETEERDDVVARLEDVLQLVGCRELLSIVNELAT